ncbi:MAG: chromate transporter [Alphaproteobacteria bacterium]
MIYLFLFAEFFKIGLLAIGGGLVTIPFLMELTDKYDWFTRSQLADMIAVSESTPGPIGVNMATYAGFNASGFLGGIVATFGLLLPSLIIIILISRFVMKYQSCMTFQNILFGIRPAVLALILYAGYILAELAVKDIKGGIICAVLFLIIHRFKNIHPVFYILGGAVLGIVLKL